MKRDCGSCGKCCQMLGVPGVTRANERCKHWCAGKGCAVYKRRPEPCREFSCVWLLDDGKLFPDEMRPDRSHVLFWSAVDMPGRLVIHVEDGHPEAWDRPDVQRLVKEFLSKPRRTVVKVLGTMREVISNRALTPAEAEAMAA
ncbi:MAG: hypothetical protein K0R61_4483 [Microvirga sp.]|nr:hypothetical protein [Microvirga sp.]